jgi:hypothetical protein
MTVWVINVSAVRTPHLRSLQLLPIRYRNYEGVFSDVGDLTSRSSLSIGRQVLEDLG